MLHKKVKNIVSVIAMLVVTGCAENHNMNPNTSQTPTGDSLPYSFSNFSDIPIPEQSEMNMN